MKTIKSYSDDEVLKMLNDWEDYYQAIDIGQEMYAVYPHWCKFGYDDVLKEYNERCL